MKLLLKFLGIVLFSLGLLSCGKSIDHKTTIRVGAMSGSESELMTTVKEVLKKDYDVDMELVTFDNYALPNEALSNGDIDANYFQHLPYLSAQIKERGYKIVSIGNVFIYPVGIFSQKLTSLSQLKVGDKVGIPNDPSNEARALLLLQSAGLITLAKNVGINATTTDIASNPKKLSIVALDAAQLPRSLSDLSIAVINSNYAVPAGLTLDKALFKEGKDSPYVNIVVVRATDKDKPQLLNLIKAMHSDAVIAKAHEIFGTGVAKGW